MKVLFLDESSDHNLTVIDDNYPVFVLGGVIVDKDYADSALTEAFDDFKAGYSEEPTLCYTQQTLFGTGTGSRDCMTLIFALASTFN